MADERSAPSPLDPPPSRRAPSALGLVRPLAALALAAFLVGRALAPAAAGVAVGVEPLIAGVDVAGSVLSQIFAIAASVTALSLVLARWGTAGNVALRASGFLLGGPVIALALRAPAARVSDTTSIVLAACSVALACLAAAASLGARSLRPVALALLVQSTGGLARLAALVLEAVAGGAGAAPSPLVRGLATAAFVADTATLGIAVAWLSTRGKGLFNPLPFVALGLALYATHLALDGLEPDASWVSVLIERSAERLIPDPDTFVSGALRAFVALAGPLVALSALLTRREAPAAVGCLALALLVQSSPEVPALSLALVVAALALSVAASRAHAGGAVAVPSAGGARALAGAA